MTANDDENSPTDADLAAIWQDAPATDMVPFLEGAEKNALAESDLSDEMKKFELITVNELKVSAGV